MVQVSPVLPLLTRKVKVMFAVGATSMKQRIVVAVPPAATICATLFSVGLIVAMPTN